MTKTNNTIWYDWNSPSGFEQLEIANQCMNEQVSFCRTVNTFKVERLILSTCRCQSKSSVVVAS